MTLKNEYRLLTKEVIAILLVGIALMFANSRPWSCGASRQMRMQPLRELHLRDWVATLLEGLHVLPDQHAPSIRMRGTWIVITSCSGRHGLAH